MDPIIKTPAPPSLDHVDPVDRLVLSQMPCRLDVIISQLEAMTDRSPGLPGKLVLVAASLEDVRAELIDALAEIPSIGTTYRRAA